MSAPTDEVLAEIYRSTTTIAVVGASSNDTKPAHSVPAYLQEQGFRIIPVNPTVDEIFGVPTVGSLAEITEHVDVVDVFRHPARAPEIAEDAVSIGADVLWLQVGVVSEQAAEIARDGGLQVVMDICMRATHQRLSEAGLI